MGANQDDPTYVKPTAGDVWDFVGQIGNWLNDDQRSGMPAPAFSEEIP
jgi:hypothetical protein